MLVTTIEYVDEASDSIRIDSKRLERTLTKLMVFQDDYWIATCGFKYFYLYMTIQMKNKKTNIHSIYFLCLTVWTCNRYFMRKRKTVSHITAMQVPCDLPPIPLAVIYCELINFRGVLIFIDLVGNFGPRNVMSTN